MYQALLSVCRPMPMDEGHIFIVKFASATKRQAERLLRRTFPGTITMSLTLATAKSHCSMSTKHSSRVLGEVLSAERAELRG